jgi:ubiquitin C-terminal hydrolase
MFGLQNSRGSCWVNACLQSFFRIPEVQKRYNDNIFEKDNALDECLCKIWRTKGNDGLKEFFQAVRTTYMPAGEGIGDSHELLQHLCDKLPFLDALCRFKVADSVKCNTCSNKNIKEDSVIEFDITTEKPDTPILECIQNVVSSTVIDTWKCEKCSNKGCTKSYLIGSFPRVMMLHVRSTKGSVGYSSILVLNSRQYALIGVVCYNGAHWWTYGRDLPIGSPWCKIDDQHIQNFGPKQFPVSTAMRILIYYSLDNNSH